MTSIQSVNTDGAMRWSIYEVLSFSYQLFNALSVGVKGFISLFPANLSDSGYTTDYRVNYRGIVVEIYPFNS